MSLERAVLAKMKCVCVARHRSAHNEIVVLAEDRSREGTFLAPLPIVEVILSHHSGFELAFNTEPVTCCIHLFVCSGWAKPAWKLVISQFAVHEVRPVTSRHHSTVAATFVPSQALCFESVCLLAEDRYSSSSLLLVQVCTPFICLESVGSVCRRLLWNLQQGS